MALNNLFCRVPVQGTLAMVCKALRAVHLQHEARSPLLVNVVKSHEAPGASEAPDAMMLKSMELIELGHDVQLQAYQLGSDCAAPERLELGPDLFWTGSGSLLAVVGRDGSTPADLPEDFVPFGPRQAQPLFESFMTLPRTRPSPDRMRVLRYKFNKFAKGFPAQFLEYSEGSGLVRCMVMIIITIG